MKTRDGAKWTWARTGALLLFLITGILLVSSLTTARSHGGVRLSQLDAPFSQAVHWFRSSDRI